MIKIKILKAFIFFAIAFSGTMLFGCSIQENDNEKLKDLDYTVLDKEEIPEELLQSIEGKKNTEFKITYNDEGALYICVGYGEQNTGGYSISVNDLYLTSNAIYVNTSLIGPKADEKVNNEPSYPYIVLKMEYMDKNVIFE